MAKAVKEYDLLFSKDEVKLVRNTYMVTVQAIAHAYFVNKGMTEEEIEKRIKFGKIWEEVVEKLQDDGVPDKAVIGISIEIEETLD